MSETKLATERFGTQSDVIDDTEILNLLESYHREYISMLLSACPFGIKVQKFTCGHSRMFLEPQSTQLTLVKTF